MNSNKPFLSIGELATLLVEQRGLVCESRVELERYLRRVSYYRFTGYARQYQRDPRFGDNTFLEGTRFEDIRSVIQRDEALRALLFKQLAIIEVGIRSAFAHELGRMYGNEAFYLDESRYISSNGRKDTIVPKLVRDLTRSRAISIKRYADSAVTENDTSALIDRFRHVPIWVAVEVMPFGHIANMIEYFGEKDAAKAAAAHLSVQWDPFGSVVHSLSVFRNLCCHHRQLWNRTLDIQCPVQKKLRPRGIAFDHHGPYAAILMANHYRRKIDGDVSVAESICSLIEENESFASGIYLPKER